VVSGREDEQLDFEIGADVLVRNECQHPAPAESLDRLDELMLHRVLEGASGLLDRRRALSSIIVFSTSV